MRSVHTPASAPVSLRFSRGCASAPCVAFVALPALSCLGLSVTPPPPCPAFPRRGFASRASRGLRRSGTMRAVTPARLAHAGQVSPLSRIAVRASRPQPRHGAQTSLSPSPQRVWPGQPVQASHIMSRLAAPPPPNRVRSPAGCSFASGCSPPRLAATQLPSASWVVTSHGLDLHQPDNATSRTHSWPRRRTSTTAHEISAGGMRRNVVRGRGAVVVRCITAARRRRPTGHATPAPPFRPRAGRPSRAFRRARRARRP